MTIGAGAEVNVKAYAIAALSVLIAEVGGYVEGELFMGRLEALIETKFAKKLDISLIV